MRSSIVMGIACMLCVTAMLAFAGDKMTVKPKEGYVPDAETAIKIALAVWTPIYGAANIEAQKPYKATLSRGVWTVKGSLPKEMLGGVAEADIAKDDARILRVIHGR